MSLSFLVGLFKRLRESLSDAPNSISNLKSCLKPQSNGRESFFKDVIHNANGFLETHKTQLNLWLRQEDVLSGKSGYDFTSAQSTVDQNSAVAETLAMLAENEVYQFFKILVDPRVVARGEVSSTFFRS